MNKLFSLAAGAALLALTGTAYAQEPLQLSDSQMDGVTAGGMAIANGISLAFGEVTAITLTQTSTNVVGVNPGNVAIAQAFSQGLAGIGDTPGAPSSSTLSLFLTRFR
jgi:hypothetical protein